MEITRDRQKGELYLSQRSYIKKVIDRFGMKDAKPVSTPMVHHFKLTSSESPSTDKRRSLWRFGLCCEFGQQVHGKPGEDPLGGFEMDTKVSKGNKDNLSDI